MYQVMLAYIRNILSQDVFPIVCYVLAGCFLWAFFYIVGLPPQRALDVSSGAYVALALFLFMLPEAKKLKFGNVFEFEARVKELKHEVKELKNDTRMALATYSTLVSTISNAVSQTVNVHLPSPEEASKARLDLDRTISQTESEEDKMND